MEVVVFIEVRTTHPSCRLSDCQRLCVLTFNGEFAGGVPDVSTLAHQFGRVKYRQCLLASTGLSGIMKDPPDSRTSGLP